MFTCRLRKFCISSQQSLEPAQLCSICLQIPTDFDVHPSLSIWLPESFVGRKPLSRIFCALGSVGLGSNRDQVLRIFEFIRKGFSFCLIPCIGSGLVGFLKRNQVVDVQLSRIVEPLPCKRIPPLAGDNSTFFVGFKLNRDCGFFDLDFMTRVLAILVQVDPIRYRKGFKI